MKNLKLLTVCIVLVLVCFLQIGCAPVAEEPAAEETAGEEPAEEEPAPEGDVVTLRVSVIQMDNDMLDGRRWDVGPNLDRQPEAINLLRSAFQRAAEEVSAEGAAVEISIAEVRILAAGGLCPAVAFTDFGQFDIYMLESATAQFAFEEDLFSEITTSVREWRDNNIFGVGNRAFNDANGTPRGVAQATLPVMIIYNPEIMDEFGVSLDDLSIDEFIELANVTPIVVPPNAALGLAWAHSLFGEELTEELVLNDRFYEVTRSFSGQLNDFFLSSDITAAQNSEILELFMAGEIAWTMNTSTFLRQLERTGYQGPVAAIPIPSGAFQGGSAMSFGWAVPAPSENQDMAWQIIEQVVVDPDMVSWSLANGMLPISGPGYDRLIGNPDLAAGFLPEYLYEVDPGFEFGIRVAGFSTPWHVPFGMDRDRYDRLLPEADQLFVDIANGMITFEDGLNQMQNTLREEGLINN